METLNKDLFVVILTYISPKYKTVISHTVQHRKEKPPSPQYLVFNEIDEDEMLMIC